MADWVHCNSCFLQPDKQVKFFLTNCGHIFCENCMQKASVGKCSICSTACSSIILSSQLKPDVAIFFTDPVDIIKKQNAQLIQILDFQESHRKRLVKYQKKKNLQEDSTFQNVCKQMEQFHILQRENMMMNEEIIYLKKVLDNYKSQSSSPLSQCSQSSSRSQCVTPSSLNGSPYSTTFQNMPPNGISSKLEFHQQIANEKIPFKSSRITMRTPPVNGRMGSIAGSPSQILCTSFADLRTSSGNMPLNKPQITNSQPISTSSFECNSTFSNSQVAATNLHLDEKKKWNPVASQIQISGNRPRVLPLISRPVQSHPEHIQRSQKF